MASRYRPTHGHRTTPGPAGTGSGPPRLWAGGGGLRPGPGARVPPGIAAGFHYRGADEARYLRAAQLCIEAGADTGQVQRWAEEGRHRAAITWQQTSPPAPPGSGPFSRPHTM